MKRFYLLVISILLNCSAMAQHFPIDSLVRAGNFSAVVGYESKRDLLTPEQLYQVAYSFMMTEQPVKAVEFCDRAMARGLQAPTVHFIKGMAIRESGDMKGAVVELEKACQADPNEAIFHREFAKTQLALKQPTQAIRTLRRFVARNPKEYEIQAFLLPVCNEQRQYAAADSIFQQLRSAYQTRQLPADMMRSRNVVYHIFQWRGQNVVVSRQYETPTAALTPLYRMMLFDKNSEDVERSMVVELTALAADGDPKAPKYSLAEKGLGATLHRSYGKYWNTEAIPSDELQSAVSQVLDETYDPNVRSGPDKFKERK